MMSYSAESAGGQRFRIAAMADLAQTTPSRLIRQLSPFTLWISGLLLIGVVGRAAFWLSPLGVLDADEAVGGLMAKHQLVGQVNVFYWGQAYGGPFETWLEAPIVWVFGPSWLGLRIVPIALTAGAAYVVWLVGRRLATHDAALAAAALFWAFPSFLLWKTIRFHIFYASSLLFVGLILLQVLRVKERPSKRGFVVLGLLTGLGVWQSFQLVTVVPASLAWLFLTRRKLIRNLWIVALSALIGFAPVLAWNATHHWRSSDIGTPGRVVSYSARVWQFFTTILPMTLDLRTPISHEWLMWKPFGIALYGATLTAFAWLAWVRRRSDLSLIILVAILFPFVYAISPITSVSDTPVYAVVLMPFLTLLICSWVRTPLQAVAVTSLALFVMAGSVANLHAAWVHRHGGEFAPLEDHSPLPRDFGPLIAALDRLHITRLYASYWIAYRLDFETNERIIAADMRPAALRLAGNKVVPEPDDPLLLKRHAQYQPIVARAPRPAFVIAPGFDPSSTDYGSLNAAHYRITAVPPFKIYYLPGPP